MTAHQASPTEILRLRSTILLRHQSTIFRSCSVGSQSYKLRTISRQCDEILENNAKFIRLPNLLA